MESKSPPKKKQRIEQSSEQEGNTCENDYNEPGICNHSPVKVVKPLSEEEDDCILINRKRKRKAHCNSRKKMDMEDESSCDEKQEVKQKRTSKKLEQKKKKGAKKSKITTPESGDPSDASEEEQISVDLEVIRPKSSRKVVTLSSDAESKSTGDEKSASFDSNEHGGEKEELKKMKPLKKNLESSKKGAEKSKFITLESGDSDVSEEDTVSKKFREKKPKQSRKAVRVSSDDDDDYDESKRSRHVKSSLSDSDEPAKDGGKKEKLKMKPSKKTLELSKKGAERRKFSTLDSGDSDVSEEDTVSKKFREKKPKQSRKAVRISSDDNDDESKSSGDEKSSSSDEPKNRGRKREDGKKVI